MMISASAIRSSRRTLACYSHSLLNFRHSYNYNQSHIQSRNYSQSVNLHVNSNIRCNVRHSHSQSLPSCTQPLGTPLPLDEHACSVSLPTWAAVVGYEEGDTAITSQMRCGYPRFVYHPYIIQLMEYYTDTLQNNNNHTNINHTNINHTNNNKIKKYNEKEDCLLLPTRAAAERCQAFMKQALSSNQIRLVSDDQTNHLIHIVYFPAETLAGMEAKAYWQHTGELVSSRRADMALRALGVPVRPVTEHGIPYHASEPDDDAVYAKLQTRIGTLTQTPPHGVHLTASGMASLWMALRTAKQWNQELTLTHQQSTSPSSTSCGGTSIVFGFPYLDTLKMCSRTEFCPGGVEFFGRGDEYDLQMLEDMLESRPPRSCSILFTEIPSNPLLLTPNFKKLRELATKHQFALVVDDTIGNYANVNLLGPNGADAVCTSLTKLFSGRGDAMAGAMVVNPHTPTGQEWQSILNRQQEPTTLFPADAWAMYHNSHDFLDRNARINATAEQVADYLYDHPNVESVYYPKYTDHYAALATKEHAYGGLMSIVLKPHMCQRTFFDALDISKGPSLGTNFTLMCPYTLLAHYHELDFCLAYNVQPNLLRIAIGLEDFDVLKDKLDKAFIASKLHPPLPVMTSKNK